MTFRCTVSCEGFHAYATLSGRSGTLPALSLLVLNRELWHRLLWSGMEMPTEVPMSSSWGVKGETSPPLPARLPQLSSGSSAYAAASRFSEAQTCKQVVGLGFRTYCHRRASRVSELVFFTGKHPKGPLGEFFFFWFACRSRKTWYISPQ